MAWRMAMALLGVAACAVSCQPSVEPPVESPSVELTAAADDPSSDAPLAGEWPQWRGPNRDEISRETGLLDAWPDGGPRLLWTAHGLGSGFSSVAVVGERIYTIGDRDNDGQYVVAISALDGKVVWTSRLGDVWEPGNYSGPRCTPTVDGNVLYALGPHGDLVCLSADSGQRVWHRNIEKDFKGHMQGRWGYSESPLVDGDRLLCTPGGANAGIVALDKKTGKEIWKTKIPRIGSQGDDAAGYASIVVSHGAGVRQYVQVTGRGVVGLDAKDGKYLWGYNKIANPTANIPTALVFGDYVFASTGYQAGAALVKLSKSGSGVKASDEYFLEGRTFQNHHGGMVMVGDYIYAGHGHNAGAPTCLNWRGGEIVWRQNRGPGNGSMCLTYADGHLYMRFDNGVMALVEATPEAFRLKSTFRIPDVEQPSWSHPVVAGGRLYLREQDALLCYDVRK